MDEKRVVCKVFFEDLDGEPLAYCSAEVAAENMVRFLKYFSQNSEVNWLPEPPPQYTKAKTVAN